MNKQGLTPLAFCLSLAAIIQVIAGASPLEVSRIKPKVNGTCGISTGGPLVQQLTRTISCVSGIFWEVNGNRIAYVDRYGSAFGSYWPETGNFNRWPLTEAEDYVAVFPVKNATDLRFVIAVDRKLILIYSTGSGENQTAHIFDLISITNTTDEVLFVGKTDSLGRAWFSSGTYDGNPIGKLYKIENLEEPVVMEENLHTGAGMAWTKDNKYFYLVDKFLGLIYKYNFDLISGTISNRSIAFNISEHTNLGGKPFDIQLDDQDYLWISMWQGGSVIQYDETSRTILWQIPIPASKVVSLEFGGIDLNILYVGTSKHSLQCTKKQPGAGAMYSIAGLGVKGIGYADIVIPEKYLHY